MSTVVNQCSFAKVFNVMWHSSTTPKVIRGGFKQAVIFPYNPSSMFDYSKLAPTAIRQGTHTSASDATVLPPSTEATTTSPVSIPTVTAVPEPPALVLHLCTEPSTGGFVAHIPQSPDGQLFDTRTSPSEVPDMFEALVCLEKEIGKTEREFWHSCNTILRM